ncbi:hypothetical protein MKEN_00865700 [Mycena kentingensis (nom. inval.)]|nr:hypothetical protein MKEN_00865700 [Mycena kentingensis (nom. inval.)]
MPTTTTRTYSRKSAAKRRADDTVPEAKRRKLSPEGADDVPTDVEDEPVADATTPKRAVAQRDSTELFESVTPSKAPAASPSKLAKRMLSRSRTESSMASGSGSSSGSIFRVPSKPTGTTSTSTTARATPSPPKPTVKPSPGPIARTKSVGAGRTYAGASRSFLVPIPVDQGSLEKLQEELDDEYASRESYTALRTRWGVDVSEDDPYVYGSPAPSDTSTPNGSPSKKGKGKARPEPVSLPNGMMNPLKSITELRNQGESRRFLDGVGYLWEGLHVSVGLGLRRTSALEINTKLCDSEFARKAKTADFIGQTWELLLTANEEKDKIMNILVAFFCALVAQDQASLAELGQRPGGELAQTLFSLLDASSPSTDPLIYATDATQLRKLGLSKKDQSILSIIHNKITSSALFAESVPLSTALLVSHTLAALPPAVLEPTRFNLKALLGNLEEHLSPLTLATSLSSIITKPKDHPVALTTVHNLLTLFDAYLLSGWAPPPPEDIDANHEALEDARDAWLADGLLSFAMYAEASRQRQAARLIALRLLVGLTHSDKVWCGRLKKRDDAVLFVLRTILRGHAERLESVKEEEDDQKMKSEDTDELLLVPGKMKMEEEEEEGKAERDEKKDKDEALDALCLGLGLLTNLVQVDDDVKVTLRDIYISSDCVPSKCLDRCKCPRRMTSLKALVEVYTHLLDIPLTTTRPIKPERDTSPSPDDLLAAGETRLLLSHFALLFGLLMADNERNQRALLAELPEAPPHVPHDGDAGKVQMLIVNAREFAYLYSGDADKEEGNNVRKVIWAMEELRDGL